VVLDLGAGSNFTVLDFFLLARRGIVVVTPEPTSLENAEHFVRTAFYRSLHEVARRPDVASAVRRLRENGSPRRVRSAGELIALVRAIDPPAAKPLEDRARTFSPLLVVNKVGSPAQRSVGPQLVSTCRERHGVQLELAALLAADPNVSEAVFRGQTTLQAFPHSAFSRHIEALAERLLHGTQGEQFRERPVPRPRASAPVTRGAIPVRRAAADVAAPSRLPAIDPAEPGAHLRRCREALGLSLVEMTERTRIRILEQIEAERFDLLPPEPYLKGYLIEYARELGMAEIGLLVKSYLEKGARRASSPVEPAPPGGPQASAGGPQQEAQSLPRGLRLRRWRR
jgi:MinD-like ATPase involved in chromosome partitioning or flagellar assembly